MMTIKPNELFEMTYEGPKEFFEDMEGRYFPSGDFGGVTNKNISIEELYQHFKARMLEERNEDLRKSLNFPFTDSSTYPCTECGTNRGGPTNPCPHCGVVWR